MDNLDAVLQRIVEVHGQDLSSASAKQRAFVMVYGAQSIIDNGGFQYFFENDWPGQPAYDEFVSAYREVGLPDEAEMLARAASVFPFARPHLYADKRNAFLNAHRIPKDMDKLYGDRVWPRLSEYVQAHERELRA